jgi:hypothetical protein
MTARASRLAERILEGARALAAVAEGLDERQWATPIPGDGRSVGVVVHHVASMYPIEVDLARKLASGNPIEGVTWPVIHEINARHASEHRAVTKAEALALLRTNAAAAAAAIAAFTDEELDSAARVSLNAEAPLTAQFFIEDHALRHSFHHLDKIRGALSL